MTTTILHRLLHLLLIVLIPTLLILGAIRVLMTDTYLQIEYNKPDFPADPYGFTLEDRLKLAPLAMQYLLNGAGIDYLGDQTFADGRPLYTDRELSHMVDVKHVIQLAMAGLLIGVLMFAAITALAWRDHAGRVAWRLGMAQGAGLLLILLVALVVYLLLDWDRFFDSFHNLFFSQGTWTFEFSDTLIRLFPIRFWQDAAITAGALAGTGAILILVMIGIIRRRVFISQP
ncbi:MAG: TIGR01906 family membrane protein [Anaerolineae bacterium]